MITQRYLLSKNFMMTLKDLNILKGSFVNTITGKIKVRLAVNHVIVLSNVFSVEAACILLLHKIDKVYWSQLKTILMYLGYLYPHELNDVKVDMNIKKLLEEL